MRFNINLASQPYQDAGRFYRRWLAALAILVVATAVLVYAAADRWRFSSQNIRDLRQERQTLARLLAYEDADEQILNRPENTDVRDRSAFLNDLIRRKAFCWTQVFSDLERIMPSRMHVVSIKPELNADNQLAIQMIVAGESRERVLELMRRMEQSKTFQAVAEDSESVTTQAPDAVMFQISALYAPQPPATAAPVHAPAKQPALNSGASFAQVDLKGSTQ